MTKEEAIRVGRDKIIEMLGRAYVMEHKDLCLLWYGHEGDITTVGLGLDEKERESSRKINFGNSEFQVVRQVRVNRKTGTITEIT